MNIEELVQNGQKEWAKSIATTVCIWGAPIVACWKDRLEKMQAHNPDGSTNLLINEFKHQRSIANGADDEFVNAGSDFLYSTAVVDLSAGPISLESGDFGSRWFGVQLLDPHMETVENFGTRRTGSKVNRTIICGPKQSVHGDSNVEVVQCDSNYMYMVSRIAVSVSEDLRSVHLLQDSLCIAPAGGASPAGNYKDQEYLTGSELESLEHLSLFGQRTELSCSSGLEFYQELAAVLCHVAPRSHEAMLIELLGQIGIQVGEPFDERRLPPAVVEALIEARQLADLILSAKFYEVGRQINGWGFVRDIGRYRNDYILRALVAKHGIWANVPEESLYFIARTDVAGQPLSGVNTYQIQFEKDALPDVDAFWSLSYYDQNGRIPIDLDGPSFLNSGSDTLKYNEQGGLTIQLGPVAPGADANVNWLPTQPQAFSLNLRCYQPTEAFRCGDVFVPPIVALEGV